MDYRYRLHAGDLLRKLLDSHRDDEPGSVRELAAATGLSKSKVQALVDEDRPTVNGGDACKLAQAFHLPPRALVHPMSTSMDMDRDPVTSPHKEAPTDGPQGPFAPRSARLAHELGEHARPAVEDGEGACRGERPL